MAETIAPPDNMTCWCGKRDLPPEEWYWNPYEHRWLCENCNAVWYDTEVNEDYDY